ncbi:MAG: DnaJ C-terminal domain-containing protein [Sumerlaeia bacterium]
MSVKFKDYYETLGLKKGATADEIRKAYRAMARKYHPDVNKEPDAEDKFKTLSEAYEVLKDPEKRKMYDQYGSNYRNGQEFHAPPGMGDFHFNFSGAGPGAGASGFSDFFEMLFGNAGRAGGGARRTSAGPGGAGFGGFGSGFEAGPGAFSNDVEAEISVPVEKIIAGGTMSVRIDVDGSGGRNYDIRIPAGIAEGKRIRLSGQGQNGGDLFLKVRYQSGGPFTLEGADVIVEVKVAPWEAALGGKVPVPTPSGKINLTIPAGTSSGRKLRLKGQGVESAGQKGDLLVRVNVCTPPTLSEGEKALWQQLQESTGWNPRD